MLKRKINVRSVSNGISDHCCTFFGEIRSYNCVEKQQLIPYFEDDTLDFSLAVFLVVRLCGTASYRRCNNLSDGWKATESSFCSCASETCVGREGAGLNASQGWTRTAGVLAHFVMSRILLTQCSGNLCNEFIILML